MEESVKPKTSLSSDESLSETGSAYSSGESTSQSNWLIILGIIGAVGAAVAAFIILGKRK
jgi:hypothetical protein